MRSEVVRVFRTATLVAAGLLVCDVARAQEATSSDDPFRYLTVTGVGQATAEPDIVELLLTIEVTAGTADSAAARNASVLRAIRSALDETGATGVETVTESYTVQPGRRDQRTNDPFEHKATHTLRVIAQDVSDAGRLVDLAVSSGPVQVRGVRFGLKDAEPLREEALRLAVDAAKRKARLIAELTDLELGDVHNVSIQDAGDRIPNVGIVSSAAGGRTSVEPQDVSASSTVTLTFRIMN